MSIEIYEDAVVIIYRYDPLPSK